MAKRRAVRVRGGIVAKPSFVTGIERPHMTASSSKAPRLRMEACAFGRTMLRSELSERVPAALSIDIKQPRFKKYPASPNC